jgi:hypothetical protein
VDRGDQYLRRSREPNSRLERCSFSSKKIPMEKGPMISPIIQNQVPIEFHMALLLALLGRTSKMNLSTIP